MPRGGFRANAGRPRGGKKAKAAPITVPSDVKTAARKSGMTPLDYMLTVMNDDAAAMERRDRMAIAAAPFVHSKAEGEQEGKKAQRQANAEAASSAGKFAVPGGPKLVVNNRK
jgi:hypothetical protein